MVIDTSAIIAILLGEPEAKAFSFSITADSKRLMSAFSVLEAGIVIEVKKGEAGGRELDLLLHRTQIEIIPMDADQTELARTAWRKYGKGRHPAGLNIGDCYAYALSKTSGEPLLFKGDGFINTDVNMVQINHPVMAGE
jgi:ribonuclease VapC